MIKAYSLLNKELPKLFYCRMTRLNDIVKRVMNYKISIAEIPKSYAEVLELIESNFDDFDTLLERRA
jgi:hypothetical protein